MISVVIPARNSAATIERALDSVLNQTFSDVEVLVIDDGSTDSTAQIVRFRAQRDVRVRLISIAHAGPGAARNAGIAKAQGEWVVFLDADDEYAPDTFQAVLERIGGRDVGLVIFSIHVNRSYIYAWPGEFASLGDELFLGEGERAQGLVDAYFQRKRMLIYSQSNKFYRKSILDRYDIRFPEHTHFGEDRLFNFAYLRVAGSVITMQNKFLTYNQGRPGSLTTSPTRDEAANLLILAESKLELFRDFGYSEDALEEFRRHNARELLSEITRVWVLKARQLGFLSTRRAVRNLLAASLDAHHFRAEAAASRRIRILQYAMRTRSATLVALLVYVMRASENRQILRKRATEIDSDHEAWRLHLETAHMKERRRYFFLADYERFLDVVNPEHKRQLLRDKAILLNRLRQADPSFVGRNWIDLRAASFADFEVLVQGADRVVAKLHDGSWSDGTSIIDTRARDFDVRSVYNELLDKKQYLVEQYIEQHTDIARFYDRAVASLRVHTLNVGGEVRLVLRPSIKFGSAGAETSNRHELQAFVDLDAGIIATEGMFDAATAGSTNTVHATHPDSGVQFKGAPYPYSQETKSLVIAAAKLMPEVPFIGWDIAMTPEGPVLLEGNAASLIIYSWQYMNREFFGVRGMRKEFEAMLATFDRYERRLLHRQRIFGSRSTKGYAWQPPS